MRKLLVPVTMGLLLSACIPVEDYGAYWDRGVLDPALEGRWQKIGRVGEHIDSVPGAEELRFERNGSSYSMQSLNRPRPMDSGEQLAQLAKDNDIRMPARTLRLGDSTLLLTREPGRPKGIIERYAITGNTLQIYTVSGSDVADLVDLEYPEAVNIVNGQGGLSIKLFDDDVFRVLSDVAGDERYWLLECEYWKTSK